MRQITADKLPPCIHAFIETVNAADSARFLACFAKDALVNDVQRDFLGTQAINAWSDREVMVGELVLKIHRAFEHYGDYVVEVHTDGNFDKTHLPDPLIITQHMSVRDNKIVKMITILVKPADVSVEDALAANAGATK